MSMSSVTAAPAFRAYGIQPSVAKPACPDGSCAPGKATASPASSGDDLVQRAASMQLYGRTGETVLPEAASAPVGGRIDVRA